MEEWFKVKEVAKRLRVHPMTVYRLIHAGQLCTVRVGKAYRISGDSLREYLNGKVADGLDREVADGSAR